MDQADLNAMIRRHIEWLEGRGGQQAGLRRRATERKSGGRPTIFALVRDIAVAFAAMPRKHPKHRMLQRP